MHKFEKQCKFYILGQGSTYLFLYLLFFILLLNYVAANAFGIWNLRNTVKSVTNWVTHSLLWKVWTQESFQKYVEFDRPGERSHCQQQQSYAGLTSTGWSNSTYITHVIVHTTLILICLLLDAFLDIASFKPWHGIWFSHTLCFIAPECFSQCNPGMQVHKLINLPMKETWPN